MNRFVAVTQRVEDIPARHERRDALDQRWTRLLRHCGLCPLPLPNDAAAARALIEAVSPVGVILTGGNDLTAVGGDAPERDAIEAMLIDRAMETRTPLLAVCRGLQLLAHHSGARLEKADGHAGVEHVVRHPDGTETRVNSYHDWVFKAPPPGFTVEATARDGTIEAIRHRDAPVQGVMWHPERNAPFSETDLALVGDHFGGVVCVP
jgi:putative glutamine amidotransferase